MKAAAPTTLLCLALVAWSAVVAHPPDFIAENTTTVHGGNPNKTTTIKDGLKDKIKNILKTLQLEPGTMDLPDSLIPDSLTMTTDIIKSYSLTNLKISNAVLHRQSNITLKSVRADLRKMEVYVKLFLKTVVVDGDYSMSTWFVILKNGPFAVTLTDVGVDATLALRSDANGCLRAVVTAADVQLGRWDTQFEQSGLVASVINKAAGQSVMELVEDVEPAMIKEANAIIDATLRAAFAGQLPRARGMAAGPITAAAAEYVRRAAYDPYRAADRRFSLRMFDVNITNLTVEGLSTIRPAGDIGLQLVGPPAALRTNAHVIVGPVTVSFGWRCRMPVQWGSLFGHRSGVAAFGLKYVQIRVNVSQPLGGRPTVDALNMEIGPLAAVTGGLGWLGPAVENAVDRLTVMWRRVLADVIEEPVRELLQVTLDDVQLEDMVADVLDTLIDEE